MEGVNMQNYYSESFPSPLGEMTAVSDGIHLTALTFCGQKYYEKEVPSDAVSGHLPVFDEVKEWLTIYFEGHKPDFMPSVKLSGSEFQQDVWEILRRIPYGKTVTYGDIAKEIAAKRGIRTMSAQAVGGAVGHNPVAILVPCHRVVGKNGNLTGYAGGIERKMKLLECEGIPCYFTKSDQ